MLTVWSYVLDTDDVTVTLDDGRKFDGQARRRRPAARDRRAQDRRRGPAALQPRRPAVAVDVGSARAGLQQPVRRRHRQRAGQRAARHRRGQDAARRPPRRLRNALSRPGLRARRHDEQSRRRRRRADRLAAASCSACSARSCAARADNIWLNYAIPDRPSWPRPSTTILAGKYVRQPADEPQSQSPRSRSRSPCWASCWCPTFWRARRRSSIAYDRRLARRHGRHQARRPGAVRQRPTRAVVQARSAASWRYIDRADPVKLTLLSAGRN